MVDKTNLSYDRDEQLLQSLVDWTGKQANLAEARRTLIAVSGMEIEYKAFSRVVNRGRWDRKGDIKKAWLRHPDSAAHDLELGREHDEAASAPPEAVVKEDEVDAQWEPTDEPDGVDEDHSHSGESASPDWAIQQVMQAETIAEIASYADAPVLMEVPGLDLEDARDSALLKINGWTPTDRDRRPPGLYGDGPLLLYLGENASYADEGARQIAFAPGNARQDGNPYYAQQMRYGVSIDTRQQRYAVDSHSDRPDLIGYRKADWVPERAYLDNNQFFGSKGFQRDDGTWMPSRAEVLAYLYHVRSIEFAFQGSTADESPFFLTVQKLRMELEYELLGADYRMSFHHHGVGTTIPDSTRLLERRTLASQISGLEERIKESRRRHTVLRTLSSPIAPARYLLQRGEQRASEDVITTGEDYWQALDPPWDRRDRTTWYEDGTGPISPEGMAQADVLPAPGEPFIADRPEESLLRIRPPRVGEFTMAGFQSVLASLGEGHTLSLEVVGSGEAVELMVRTVHPDKVCHSMELHYPGTQFERVMPEDDPLRLHEDDTGWRRILRPVGPEFLPFSVYDERTEPPTADPFLDVIGALGQDLHTGERLVSRGMLRQKPHGWSEKWRARALSGPGSANARMMERERQQARDSGSRSLDHNPSAPSEASSVGNLFNDPLSLLLIAIVVIALGAAVAVRVESLIESTGAFVASLYILAGATAFGIVGIVAWRTGLLGALARLWKPTPPDYHDPSQVETRISGAAYEFEVQTIAILGGRGEKARAEQLLEMVGDAYRGFNSEHGCRFEEEQMRSLVTPADHSKLTRKQRKSTDILHETALEFGADSRRYSLMSRRPAHGIVGIGEASAFWHPISGSVDLPLVRRVQSRRLRPSVATAHSGALIGVAKFADGGKFLVYLPDEVKGRHKFLISRTQMGKSTTMCHIGGELMAEMARGETDYALVVIDPHSYLVRDLLLRVPEEIVDRVALVDLDDPDRAIGINLLDTRVFEDRDKAVEAIIEVAKGTWETWGSRMEAILTHVMKSMHEANRSLPGRSQLTILDGASMLSDEAFRDAVLDRVQDPVLLDWWRSAHGGWAREYGQDAVAPVVTRLSSFSGSTVVRSILGQRSCTLDLKAIIQRGDVLLVNTSQSFIGPEVAALIGVSILKLVDTIVTEQGTSEGESPRRVSVIVDEMHTLQGVDFQKILSQIAKRGGVLTMATQSLASLDILGRTFREDILANTGVILTFQVNAADARHLLPELRSEYLDEADITGLPVHNLYMRLIGVGEVDAPFTTEVLPPFDGDWRIEQIVKQGTQRYARSRKVVLEDLSADMEEQVKLFRAQIHARHETHRRDGNAVDLRKRGGRRRRKRRGRPSDGNEVS